MFSILQPTTLDYPAHGAGTLCGKALKQFNASTIGVERLDNWAVVLAHTVDEDTFVEALVTGQPHIPKYFPNSVEVNRRGPKGYAEALAEANRLGELTAEVAKTLDRSLLIVDARPAYAFRKGHLKGAINIPLGKSFNTWLGTIVAPQERYYLVVSSPAALESALDQVLAIGYEENLAGVLIATDYAEETGPALFSNVEVLRQDGKAYTVVDVRDPDEVGANPGIPHSLKIRLAGLREEIEKIPTDKPILVHCAGGYRSAVGSSILLAAGRQPVYDVGEAITQIL